MPDPTNPKKRALMPSTKLRKTLRGAGHHLSPVVQIGKEGVSSAVLRQLDEQLAAHELVKVKVGTESPEDRFEAAERLGEAAGAKIAQVLGRTVLVYRRHPERPRFEPFTPAEERERDIATSREPTAKALAAARRTRRGGKRSVGRGGPARREAEGRGVSGRGSGRGGPSRPRGGRRA